MPFDTSGAQSFAPVPTPDDLERKYMPHCTFEEATPYSAARSLPSVHLAPVSFGIQGSPSYVCKRAAPSIPDSQTNCVSPSSPTEAVTLSGDVMLTSGPDSGKSTSGCQCSSNTSQSSSLHLTRKIESLAPCASSTRETTPPREAPITLGAGVAPSRNKNSPSKADLKYPSSLSSEHSDREPPNRNPSSTSRSPSPEYRFPTDDIVTAISEPKAVPTATPSRPGNHQVQRAEASLHKLDEASRRFRDAKKQVQVVFQMTGVSAPEDSQRSNSGIPRTLRGCKNDLASLVDEMESRAVRVDQLIEDMEQLLVDAERSATQSRPSIGGPMPL